MRIDKDRAETIRQLIRGARLEVSTDVVSDEFEAQGWNLHTVFCDGAIAGGIIERDGSIHTSIAPEYQKKWNPRPYIKTILYPALLKHGIVLSEVCKDDQRAIRWLTRLGFRAVASNADMIHFELTALHSGYTNEVR